MLNNKKMDHYTLLGNPVSHSLSPLIHRTFAKQTKQPIRYDTLLVEPHAFEKSLLSFQKSGGKGVNITSPFKQQAFYCVDTMSDRAKKANSINTIVLKDNGERYGDNTDGVGLIRDLTVNHAISLQEKRLLILGAGGASFGILLPLLEQHPAEIIISNRTMSKAEAQRNVFESFGKVVALPLNKLTGSFDLIINTTTASIEYFQQIPRNIINNKSYCYDLVYQASQTAFLSWAAANHAAWWQDGLGMLIEQAAEAFYVWRNIRPETSEVAKLLRGNND